MASTFILRHGVRALLVIAGASTMAASAQTTAVEKAPAAAAFEQWVGAKVAAPSDPAASINATVPLSEKGGRTNSRFEPAPVILGAPDLPLVGNGAAQTTRGWGPALNYQGLHAAWVFIDKRSGRRSAMPLSVPVRYGQHFKLRLTPTFDAVASIDHILGTGWNITRGEQVFPAKSGSVTIKGGETVELPLGDGQYFVLDGKPADERLLLTVRHVQATGPARDDQPAYRQDGKTGSSYLQLMSKGKFTAIEQLLAATR